MTDENMAAADAGATGAAHADAAGAVGAAGAAHLDAAGAADAVGAAQPEEEFEYFEMEVSEEDIVCYLVDEDDNEVGFVVMENGEEVEYFYADDEGVEYVYVDAEAEAEDDDGFLFADDGPAATACAPARDADAGAGADGTARESRIKPLSAVAAGAGGTADPNAGAANASPSSKSGVDAATDKMMETIHSDEFKSAARDIGALYKETAEATKELREAYKDVKDTIDMFNPKKLFKL